MDDFLEGTFSEDSNELDHGETEATLYSLVHHSEDTYNTSMLQFNGGYIRQRNSTNRWEAFKQIGDTVKPDNFISRSQELNQALDHIPFNDNNFPNNSETMFGQQFNKRGQNYKYYWNNHRFEKPWNVNDRIRNNYHRNSNLVPILVQNNVIDQQYPVDTQAVLKINNFSDFESPRSNIHTDIHHSESPREDIDSVKYGNGTSRDTSLNLSGSSRDGCTSDNKTNSNCGLKTSGDYGTTSNKGQSTSSITGECSKDPTRNTSGILLNHNANTCAVQNNTNEIVELSSTNKASEVVIISDTDGNDCSDESVVEVCGPPKPLPPVVALDSSDESESLIVSNESLVLNISEISNKSSINCSHSSQNTSVRSKSIKKSLTISSTSKEIKRKKKKKKKRHANSFECKAWTSGMIHFYNKSWGGETYDHQKLQQAMTTNPNKWKILDVDKYGPVRDYGPFARVRCANCHQFGHLAKQCPDPKKIRCCAMCGEQGHQENQCPNKICLKCGRPAPLFNEGCPSCWNNPLRCVTCGGVDHFNWLCPDVWRKLHSVTSTEELERGILEETTYKLPVELNCCLCAGKGHLAAQCQESKQNLTSPRNSSVDIFSAIKIVNKKRKKKRSSFFEGQINQQEFNRKRRKTN